LNEIRKTLKYCCEKRASGSLNFSENNVAKLSYKLNLGRLVTVVKNGTLNINFENSKAENRSAL
jgi:hypothetical protein